MPWTGQHVAVSAADAQLILPVGGHGELVAGRILRPSEELGIQNVWIINRRLENVLLGCRIAEHKVHCGGSAAAITRDLDIVNLALLGRKRVPVLVAPLLDSPSDFARRADLLRGVGWIVMLIVQH